MQAEARLWTVLFILLPMLTIGETPSQAIGLSATTSSREKPEFSAANVIDGDLHTRWSSAFSDPQWLKIDMGVAREVGGIDIYWESGHAADYEVQLSEDDKSWTGVWRDRKADGGMDSITFEKRKARYIRIQCHRRATEWGNSIFEIAIDGIHEVTNAIPEPDRRRQDVLIREDTLVLEWLKQMQDVGTPDRQLLSAMEDQQLQTFNNSLVALAFLVKGERERAERILDFFAGAMDRNNTSPDRQNFYFRGEARGFFQSAIHERRRGVNGYYCMGVSDRWMGDMAWLLAAYTYYGRLYAPERYETITAALKKLLMDWFKDEGDAGYVRHGWRFGDQKLHETFGHHEGNIDAYAVFRLCGEDTYAAKIRKWLDREIQGTSLPLDLYTWRVLAYGRKFAYLLNIPDGDPRFRKTIRVNDQMITGFYHGPDPNVNNIWMDGTGHMACAYITCGDKPRGYFYANQMDAFLLDRNIRDKLTRALPYTANKEQYEWVNTERGFVSPAAWYIFAKNAFNPMTLTMDTGGMPAMVENPYQPYMGAGSALAAFPGNMGLWNIMVDNGSAVQFRNSGTQGIDVEFSFGSGQWGLARKQSNTLQSIRGREFCFEVQAEGGSCNLELKWGDADGTVYGWRAERIDPLKSGTYTVKPSDFKYWWGGTDHTLDEIAYFDIAVGKSASSRGKLHIRNLTLR